MKGMDSPSQMWKDSARLLKEIVLPVFPAFDIYTIYLRAPQMFDGLQSCQP